MKILIIGWFGAGNMGDEAILISELLSLRKKIEGVKFYILSFDPEKTKRLTANIPEVRKILRMGSKHNIFRSQFLGLLMKFREVDAVLIGGGGIFQDIYNFYPIPFFAAMALLARLNNKHLLLYCLGIGPVHSSLGKKLCRLAVKCADMVSVRDSGSKELLENLGITREIFVSADPVFLLKAVKTKKVEKVIQVHNLNSKKLVIGICVQDLLFWDNKNKEILADTLDTLTTENKAKVVFLPLGTYRDGWFNKETSDTVDMIASKRLVARMNEKFFIITDELTPQELLAVIGKMDILISMRLHGLIMGITMNVSVVALTYTEESKITNLMKRIGQEDSLFDVRKLDKKKLLTRINYLLSEKGGVKRHIKKEVTSLRGEAEKCNEKFYRTLQSEKLRRGERKSLILKYRSKINRID